MYRVLSVLILAACYGMCHAQSTNSSLSVSNDGSCGELSNRTCLDSVFGSCCSLRGFCGSTSDFCSPTAGCQSSFGSCSTNTSFISYDGKCGSTDPNSQVCVGSTYGSCCSSKGWCGSTADYCGVGCQSTFGTCGGENITIETNADGASSGTAAPTTSSNSVISTSTSAASSSTSHAGSTDSSNATNSTVSDVNKSDSSLISLEVAIGVLCGLLAALSVFVAMLLLKRRSRQRPEHTVEKSGADSTFGCGPESCVEAPSTHYRSTKDSLSSAFGSFKQNPVELGSTGHGRAELRESYIEIDNQRRW